VSDSVRDLLARLVDATPGPPDGGDPEQLLAAFDAMLATRAALLHALDAATPLPAAAIERELVDELARRDHAWLAALGLARHVVADRLVAVRRARRPG